jgi:hypothetical protein
MNKTFKVLQSFFCLFVAIIALGYYCIPKTLDLQAARSLYGSGCNKCPGMAPCPNCANVTFTCYVEGEDGSTCNGPSAYCAGLGPGCGFAWIYWGDCK